MGPKYQTACKVTRRKGGWLEANKSTLRMSASPGIAPLHHSVQLDRPCRQEIYVVALPQGVVLWFPGKGPVRSALQTSHFPPDSPDSGPSSTHQH